MFYDFIVSLILMVLGELFILLLLQCIRTPPEIMNEALQCVLIFIGGLPFLMLYDVLRQMMIGCRDF
ncbi:MAG: MATE family efflux transporter [Beduini sp.]|uniref:MATE family efflux transporter n=1 Tax=Beduini sp. TaxID=1922300 RepID=UPI0011C7BA4E